MRTKAILALIGVVAALAVGLTAFWLRPPTGGPEPAPPAAVAEPAEPAPPPTPIESAAPPQPMAPAASESVAAQPPPPPKPPAPVNKAERLAQLRETFRTLAAGDLKTALHALLDSDPAAAFAVSERLAAGERRQFFDSFFASWAQKDTDAALQWAEQLSDDTERDAAIKAIRNVAPAGIGAELRMQDGYAVINRLLPGTPAELGGQLRPGDRILALAQGDYAYVDARGMALKDLVDAIRGAPGTLLQLRVLSADAPPDSWPRTVSIVRGQIKFKQ